MLCKDSGMLFSKKTVANLFAASKMTVISDSDEKGQLQYMRMTFVEFLELIGRSA
jgi:hypothetical protein